MPGRDEPPPKKTPHKRLWGFCTPASLSLAEWPLPSRAGSPPGLWRCRCVTAGVIFFGVLQFKALQIMTGPSGVAAPSAAGDKPDGQQGRGNSLVVPRAAGDVGTCTVAPLSPPGCRRDTPRDAQHGSETPNTSTSHSFVPPVSPHVPSTTPLRDQSPAPAPGWGLRDIDHTAALPPQSHAPGHGVSAPQKGTGTGSGGLTMAAQSGWKA